MKVYVLILWCYEILQVVGVYSTRELAEAAKNDTEDYQIRIRILDGEPINEM